MVKETSEIVKLTERVSKDPKSKLFVPLAEEYKKTGDLEMAVYVLIEGLKNNPGYVTARSILGRLLFEQGDLAGSQKELEEVVKVIPDNLLAQRKLGDICILQNNPVEAVRHYKSVLSLNPRDNEVASIISDIEAGRDVSLKIPQPKPLPPSEKVKPQEIKPQPLISPASQAQAARSGTRVATPPASVSRAEQPEVLKTPAAVSAAVPTAAEKIEEPEEILTVEPLDKRKPDQKSRAAVLDFLSEQRPGQTHTPSKEEPVEMPFVPSAQHQNDLQPSDLIVTEQGILNEQMMSREAQAVDVGKSVKDEITRTKTEQETPGAHPEIVLEGPSGKSDDFTTDTLAELYIAQGFYEKAIDIYARMLVDNPNSRGLKDKLDRVKTMAAAVSAAEAEENKGSTDIFAEPQVYSTQQEPADAQKTTAFLGEPGKEKPAAKTEERPPAGLDNAIGKFVSPPDQGLAQEKLVYTDFEPREYMPPAAKTVETKAEKVLEAPKSPTAIRKETIHRLEAWLKNIKKET
jgi:tetratricopeptide (TPR) repeat protein